MVAALAAPLTACDGGGAAADGAANGVTGAASAPGAFPFGLPFFPALCWRE